MDGDLDAEPGHGAGAFLDAGAADVELERGGGPVDAYVLGAHGHVEVADQEVVAEGDPVLGVRQEDAGLADRFGGDQRVVAAVHGGEEAVPAGPLGGDGEAVLFHARPVGQHDLGDARAVDEFLGNGGGQRPEGEGAGPGGGRIALAGRDCRAG